MVRVSRIKPLHILEELRHNPRHSIRRHSHRRGVTPKTVTWYQTAFDALTRTVAVSTADHLTKPLLQDFVVRLRERGFAPVFGSWRLGIGSWRQR